MTRSIYTFLTTLSALFLITACDPSPQGFDQKDPGIILDLLSNQEDAWNEGNIEDFMTVYWHSDSLAFYNANGMTYGWQATLDNYKVRYPDRDAMGQLTFGVEALTRTGPDGYYLVGTYHLDRKADTLDGYFTLIWKKIEEDWKIVMDMTCAL